MMLNAAKEKNCLRICYVIAVLKTSVFLARIDYPKRDCISVRAAKNVGFELLFRPRKLYSIRLKAPTNGRSKSHCCVLLANNFAFVCKGLTI